MHGTIKQKLSVQWALCGKRIIIGKHDQQKTIVEEIDGESYTFDSTDCILMFKKFRSVYGFTLFTTSQKR